MRGLYFSLFIGELFIMSKVLTEGFSKNHLLSVMYSIDGFALRRVKKGEFFVILYHILRIFHNTYSELGIFFKRGKIPLKKRVLIFINSAFERSVNEYESLHKISVTMVKPHLGDYIYIFFQIAVLSAAFLLKRFSFYH